MPFPGVTIPGVPPTGKCCLTQVHKVAEGHRLIPEQEPAYLCCVVRTARGDTKITLGLTSAGPPCDQNPQIVPNGSVLEAAGNTIIRADGFAHFFGQFTISDPSGTALLKGVTELIDRIGSHHAPLGTEACNQEDHFEGWMVAAGLGPLSNHTLRALIVARGNLPTGTSPAGVFGSLDGVLIQCT